MQRLNLPINFHHISQSMLQDTTPQLQICLCVVEWQLGMLMRRQSSHFSYIDSLYTETLMDASNGCYQWSAFIDGITGWH
jgi:hypothetical protein